MFTKNDRKRIFTTLGIILLIITYGIIMLSSCTGRSEGTKFGTLQKVSHKRACNQYVAEFAYEGGRGDGENGYNNSQEISISKEAYDTLQQYIGDKIVFEYEDLGGSWCGPSKRLKSLKIKK